MTSGLDKPIVGFRFVETRHGDTLQMVASRELGDASRWPEIVSYNALVPPFITDDPNLAGDGVALTGQQIMVPAPVPVSDASTNPNATFLSDVKLKNGLVEADEAGDLLLCSGFPNLHQALSHRVRTQRSELMYHPGYGSLLHRLIGTVNGPTANVMAAQYARSAVEQDPRVHDVKRSAAEVIGDAINVSVEAVAINGRTVEINEII